MSRAKIRRTQRKSRRVSAPAKRKKKKLKLHCFIGISLGGGKTDKTCQSVVEYYPQQKKIFLSRLFDKIKTEGDISSDWQVHKLITKCPPPLENVSFDVPLQMPKCVTCQLKCPGYELCQEPEILWMWRHYRELETRKSPPRLFTPYTERCVEQYLQDQLEEPFHLPHSLGANFAPLTARAHFLSRRLKVDTLEVFPKLSLWRIGTALGLPESDLRYHRHWEAGASSRQAILGKLIERNLAFIYDQDVKTLIEFPQAFDSFLCALTGLLSFLGHCEARPRGFPKSESWIAIPKKSFPWP